MDFLAGFFELLGLWKIGNKQKLGFIFNFFCNVLWVNYVLIYGQTYGLLLVVIPAAFINMRNYLKWSNEKASN